MWLRAFVLGRFVALPPAQLRILGRGWWGAPRPRRRRTCPATRNPAGRR
jgi:hypothetical protein